MTFSEHLVPLESFVSLDTASIIVSSSFTCSCPMLFIPCIHCSCRTYSLDEHFVQATRHTGHRLSIPSSPEQWIPSPIDSCSSTSLPNQVLCHTAIQKRDSSSIAMCTASITKKSDRLVSAPCRQDYFHRRIAQHRRLS